MNGYFLFEIFFIRGKVHIIKHTNLKENLVKSKSFGMPKTNESDKNPGKECL